MDQEFQEQGFLILDGVISENELQLVEEHIENTEVQSAGTRTLLKYSWCRSLANSLKDHPSLSQVIPRGHSAKQCIYFKKTPEKNWSLRFHRDRSIPVKEKIESPDWDGWSTKEGVVYAQPPQEVLKNLVTVRVHLEDNTQLNGPLKVIPKSHHETEPTTEEHTCLVKERGAVVMRPLLLHSSKKMEEGIRRVLHFVFGPDELPGGVEWAY